MRDSSQTSFLDFPTNNTSKNTAQDLPQSAQNHYTKTIFREKNLALMCDFYEFLMSNGYRKSSLKDTICYFDVFFRSVPDNGGFVIASGQDSIVDFINNLQFSQQDLEFLRVQNLFSPDFLAYLSEFKFSGDIYGVREGEVVFANEPILTVRAKASEAQILETFILLALNHQSLIATKTNRIVRAAQTTPNTQNKHLQGAIKQRAILEFGSRRAQGIDAALNGARAAYIGGVEATACTLAGKIYGIKVAGTMAHSWVQAYESELEAFRQYCKMYPNNAILLIDTYDSLHSGIQNAIIALKELLKSTKNSAKNYGVRIDSGDLCALSKEIRKRLDSAGLQEAKIVASGALDEIKIKQILQDGACIDAFGVGERLITAKSAPVLGCVYKLVAKEQDKNGQKEIIPTIKISEEASKISLPHFKKLYRFFDAKSGKAAFDKLYLYDEDLDKSDENLASKNLISKELHIPYFKNGVCVYKKPTLSQIRAYTKDEVGKLNENLKQIQNPQCQPNHQNQTPNKDTKATQDFETSKNQQKLRNPQNPQKLQTSQTPIYEVRLSQKLRTLREALLAKKSH